jgi:hypothetical protein
MTKVKEFYVDVIGKNLVIVGITAKDGEIVDVSFSGSGIRLIKSACMDNDELYVFFHGLLNKMYAMEDDTSASVEVPDFTGVDNKLINFLREYKMYQMLTEYLINKCNMNDLHVKNLVDFWKREDNKC